MTYQSIQSIDEIKSLVCDTELEAIHVKSRIKGVERDIVFLGEIHIANEQESLMAQKIMPYFDAYGLEGTDVEDSISLKVFLFIIYGILTPIISKFTFMRDMKGRSSKLPSPIDCALNTQSEKHVIQLENGFKISMRTKIGALTLSVFLIAYFLSGLIVMFLYSIKAGCIVYASIIILEIISVTLLRKPAEKAAHFISDALLNIGEPRETHMIKTLIDFAENNPEILKIIVITGKAHTKNLCDTLKKSMHKTKIMFSTV